MIIKDILNYSTLKNKFFSERLWDQKNDFIRSNYAWKITQAFWRTTRGANDFSTIILMWEKLNRTLLNKDNDYLFSMDLIEDLKLWKLISENINNLQDFANIIKSNILQESNYKEYIKDEKTKLKWKISLSNEELKEKNIIASYERKINDFYMSNDFEKTIRYINDEIFINYINKYNLTKLYWVYLTIWFYCYLKINELEKAQEFYERSVWINNFLWSKLFKVEFESINKNNQISNILKSKLKNLIFSLETDSNIFEANIKELWKLIWFNSTRPEKDNSWTTLDNLWIDEDNKVIIWFECKNEILNWKINKSCIDQSLWHYEWLKANYNWYKLCYYIIWNINYRTNNTNPWCELLLLSIEEINTIYKKVIYLYDNKDLFPNSILSKLKSLNLFWVDNIFSKDKKIIDLPIND
jgi:hypothetical protein